MIRKARYILLLLFLMLCGTYSSVFSADQNAIKIRIGLKFFRVILAADTQISFKKGNDDRLALGIIYKRDKAQADLYAQQLQTLGKGEKQGKIRGIETIVTVISVDNLEQLSVHPYAGLYLINEVDNETRQEIVDYGIRHQIITYSPFAEAVEQGISAGLIIEARTKPYVNLQTLKLSHLQLKPFFLKVSKHYEP